MSYKDTMNNMGWSMQVRIKKYEPYDDGWPQYEEPSVTIH